MICKSEIWFSISRLTASNWRISLWESANFCVASSYASWALTKSLPIASLVARASVNSSCVACTSFCIVSSSFVFVANNCFPDANCSFLAAISAFNWRIVAFNCSIPNRAVRTSFDTIVNTPKVQAEIKIPVTIVTMIDVCFGRSPNSDIRRLPTFVPSLSPM